MGREGKRERERDRERENLRHKSTHLASLHPTTRMQQKSHNTRQRPKSAMPFQGRGHDAGSRAKQKPRTELKKQTKVQINSEGNLKTFTFGPTSHPGPSGTKLYRWRTVEG